jgi:hypothetical protein
MFRNTLAAALLVVAFAGVARAQSIITPGLEPPVSGGLDCGVVNAGTKTVTYVLQVYDFNANVVINPSRFESTLAAHRSVVSSTTDDDARYCVVTMKGGGKSKVRVALSVRDAGGVLLAAVEGH